MQLTKEEKADLKSLLDHRGFKIIRKLYEEKRAELFSKFEDINLGADVNMASLAQAQNYNKGMKSIIETAEGLTAEKTSQIESLR